MACGFFYVVVQLGGFVPQLSVSGKERGIRAFCVLQRPMPGSWRKYQKEFFTALRADSFAATCELLDLTWIDCRFSTNVFCSDKTVEVKAGWAIGLSFFQ